MSGKLLAFLRSPYPADHSTLSTLGYGAGCGLFIYLFFALLEPFGFSLLAPAPRRALYAGYGLVTALIIVLNGLLLPRLRLRFFREERWNLGKQIFWMGWVTLLIGVGCYLLSKAVCARFGLTDDWVRLQTIVLDTFLIAIFPITVINLANYARLLQHNARVVLESNRRLELQAAGAPSAQHHAAPLLELLAENERDSLRLPLADLLFVHAEENYVRVHVRGERAAQPLLRSSLTRIERQLRPLYPRLFRCHRTCIVNMTQIAGVEGNAQGLKLTLKDSAAIVPVARRYVNEFRRALRAL